MPRNRRFTPLAFAFLFGIPVAELFAQEPGWSTDYATSVERATYQIINDGVNLYNQGDHAGCYRLFQGSLLGFSPSVKGSKELQSSIEAALAAAEKAATPAQKALELRKPLDLILEAARKKPAKPPQPAPVVAAAIASVPAPPARPEPKPTAPAEVAAAKPVAPPTPPASVPIPIVAEPTKPMASGTNPELRGPLKNTLWNRLGGIERIRLMIRDFLFKATNDPRVGFDRGGKYPVDDPAPSKIEVHLLEWVSSETGGPLTYRGRPIRELHAGMAITNAQFKAILEDLDDVAIAHGIVEADARELVALFARFKPQIVTEK
jgi:hemoglobin